MSNNHNPTKSFWQQSPLAAVVLGLLITEAGIIPWSIFLVILPTPWPFILMIVYLGLFVTYFSGRIFPKAIDGFRAERFRETKITDGSLKWIAAAFLFVLVIESSIVVNFRLISFPRDNFMQYNAFIMALPGPMQWVFVLVASLVAGICEETGFRGYLQVPLEKRYGASIAISSSGILFTAFHFNQPWATSIVPSILLAGILLALLAYRSKTLIIPMIAHVVMDIFNFTFWWSDLGNRVDRQTIFETGVDSHFVIWLSLLLIGLLLYLFICIRSSNKLEKPVT